MNDKLKQELLTANLDDYITILNTASKIRKASKSAESGKKIAVLGTSSIQMVVLVLEAMLYCNDYIADFYEGEYDGLKMDIFNKDSDLYKFSPDIIILLPDIHEIKQYPSMMSSKQQVMDEVELVVASFLNMYRTIHGQLPDVPILCCNIVGPFDFPLGNLECSCFFSKTNFLSLINLELAVQKPDYVTLLDMRQLSERIGLASWYDPNAYVTSKQGFSLTHIGHYCELIKKQILSLSGKIKKCLILDLDNTLWGGVVGDVGYEKIMLDPNDPEGESFLAFQQYVLNLKERGVILAICSKNDAEAAKEPFEKNKYMLLKLDDIACFTANWNDKVSNIRNIAETLNIGLDSLVFFDDNPTERALVRTFIPEAAVIEVPEDPAFYVRALDTYHAFDWLQITAEDINRNGTYISNRQREQLKLSYADYNEYLKQLHMKGRFDEVTDSSLERFVQLLNKSNQFNLMTNRYSEAQIQMMRQSGKYGLYTVSLKDIYSDYGIIACVILLLEESKCTIVDWCLSCRVLKKGVENFTLENIIKICSERNIASLYGTYKRTKKNDLVSNLYQELGFQELVSTQGEVKTYALEAEKYTKAATNSLIREE